MKKQRNNSNLLCIYVASFAPTIRKLIQSACILISQQRLLMQLSWRIQMRFCGQTRALPRAACTGYVAKEGKEYFGLTTEMERGHVARKYDTHAFHAFESAKASLYTFGLMELAKGVGRLTWSQLETVLHLPFLARPVSSQWALFVCRSAGRPSNGLIAAPKFVNLTHVGSRAFLKPSSYTCN